MISERGFFILLGVWASSVLATRLGRGNITLVQIQPLLHVLVVQ